ncbi:hypothetical protein AtEden1_Chr1g0014321 [Arabidopsis thaliana]
MFLVTFYPFCSSDLRSLVFRNYPDCFFVCRKWTSTLKSQMHDFYLKYSAIIFACIGSEFDILLEVFYI